MNIIKFKDVIVPDSAPWAEYFNTYLKGKYAYWVQMRYIVSFEHMRHEGYVACEEDITKLLQKEDGTYPKPYGAPSLDVYAKGVLHCVDTVETDRINNTVEFRRKNEYTPDADITLDELKKFRTWLATELLTMDQTELGEQKHSLFSTAETHVLKYYANDMYDDTINILNEFGSSIISVNDISGGCGCHPTSNLSGLYKDISEPCDTVALYKKNIYKKMVAMFSDYTFWTKWSPEFIDTFKKYINNIIKVGLPLEDSEYITAYADCNCLGQKSDKNTDILKRLATSLQYIYDKEIVGHKNYIRDALTDWSSGLYEKMRW